MVRTEARGIRGCGLLAFVETACAPPAVQLRHLLGAGGDGQCLFEGQWPPQGIQLVNQGIMRHGHRWCQQTGGADSRVLGGGLWLARLVFRASLQGYLVAASGWHAWFSEPPCTSALVIPAVNTLQLTLSLA